MQLSFDPRDPAASASALAIIAALHPGFGAQPLVIAEGLAFDEGGTQDSRLLPEALAFDDRADAASAFDAPSPEAAFAPSVLPAEGSAAAITQTPAPAPSPNPGGVEVDSRGLPWDARIHSGPANKKPKNADGSWRKGRGVDDATIAQVEAELRSVMGAAPPPVPVAPAPAPEVAAAPIPPAPPVPVAAPAPPAPAAEAPTPAPIAPEPTLAAAVTASGPVAATPAANFADLMRKITGLQTAGHLTVEGTAEISASLGITGVRDLMHRPDLIPSFDALLPTGGA